MASITKKYNLTPNRIFLHVLFWCTFLAAHSFFYGWPDAFWPELRWTLRYLPFKMLITYFTLYVVIPRYLVKKKYVRAVVFFVMGVAGGTLVQLVIDYAILIPVFNPKWETGFLFYPSKVYKIFLGMYPVVTIAAGIKLAKHWYEKDQQAQELKQQKLEAELSALKAQIHPHFLFNTLNNLYALTLKKSDESPEVVVKLSELLSFILYECNAPVISLEKELKLIENYIDLEKIRYDERLDIRFRKKGNLAIPQIPPMLLLPFVENAFKHGASNEIEKASIYINLEVSNPVLNFKVENSKPGKEKIPDKKEQSGTGLKNVKRRLDLLYRDYYSLDIEETKTTFNIHLQLQLNKLQPEPS